MSDVPENAPGHCPGTNSEQAGKANACAGCPNQSACASAPKPGAPDQDLVAISERMKGIKHKLLVLSGKGGVGKSTFSSQLAFALASRGKEVGLLDTDICGPSIPKMMCLEGQEVHQSNQGWSPVYVEDNLAVMSIGFMLPDPDEAVIWRGPRKNSLIKQFLKDVHWGDLDYLVVDAPPGTSDEHITIAQCLKSEGTTVSALIITTPQEVSIIDVRKEINFCKKVGINVLGVVENMSGLQQRLPLVRFEIRKDETGGAATVPMSSDVTARVFEVLRRELELDDLNKLVISTDVFDRASGGAERMCREMGVPFLGSVPLDPELGRLAEKGKSAFSDSSTTEGGEGDNGAAAVWRAPLAIEALGKIVDCVINA